MFKRYPQHQFELLSGGDGSGIGSGIGGSGNSNVTRGRGGWQQLAI